MINVSFSVTVVGTSVMLVISAGSVTIIHKVYISQTSFICNTSSESLYFVRVKTINALAYITKLKRVVFIHVLHLLG